MAKRKLIEIASKAILEEKYGEAINLCDSFFIANWLPTAIALEIPINTFSENTLTKFFSDLCKISKQVDSNLLMKISEVGGVQTPKIELLKNFLQNNTAVVLVCEKIFAEKLSAENIVTRKIRLLDEKASISQKTLTYELRKGEIFLIQASQAKAINKSSKLKSFIPNHNILQEFDVEKHQTREIFLAKQEKIATAVKISLDNLPLEDFTSVMQIIGSVVSLGLAVLVIKISENSWEFFTQNMQEILRDIEQYDKIAKARIQKIKVNN